MDKQELLTIRQQILDSALPLVADSKAAPGDRFDLLVRFLRYSNGTHSSELYKKAYEAAMQFEDPDSKLEALLQLLGEVDAEIDTTSAPVSNEPQSQNNLSEPVENRQPDNIS